MTRPLATVLSGGHSEWEPPDPFSNSEVKTLCADASVDFVDVKVGHCQALNSMQTGETPDGKPPGVFLFGAGYLLGLPGWQLRFGRARPRGQPGRRTRPCRRDIA